MRVAISGSDGFIGGALKENLQSMGHTVIPILRRKFSANDFSQIGWIPDEKYLEKEKLNGLDAVVHLAGENIFGRWTEGKKQKILKSRVSGTELLVEAMGTLSQPPNAFLCASAVGYYGDRPAETLTELSKPGKGFLASVCEKWEHACVPAVLLGVRVVNMRFGVVLSPEGGMLQKILPAFRLGLGGYLGRGTQYLSWITREDLVRAVLFVLNSSRLAGIFNFVAPHPTTNKEFTDAINARLGHATHVRVPRFAVKTLMGQMADELIFASQRVVPARLEALQFRFLHGDIQTAIQSILPPYKVIRDPWEEKAHAV